MIHHSACLALLALAGLAGAFSPQASCLPWQRTVRRRVRVSRGPAAEPLVPWRAPRGDWSQFLPLSQALCADRKVILGDFLDLQCANGLVATLLHLEAEAPSEGITLYLNLPGALLQPSLAVLDILLGLRCPVTTVNLGLAAGCAALLFAAGAKGHRLAMPHSRFLLQGTGLDDPIRGQASDVGVMVAQNVDENRRAAAMLGRLTGQPVKKQITRIL